MTAPPGVYRPKYSVLLKPIPAGNLTSFQLSNSKPQAGLGCSGGCSCEQRAMVPRQALLTLLQQGRRVLGVACTPKAHEVRVKTTVFQAGTSPLWSRKHTLRSRKHTVSQFCNACSRLYASAHGLLALLPAPHHSLTKMAPCLRGDPVGDLDLFVAIVLFLSWLCGCTWLSGTRKVPVKFPGRSVRVRVAAS